MLEHNAQRFSAHSACRPSSGPSPCSCHPGAQTARPARACAWDSDMHASSSDDSGCPPLLVPTPRTVEQVTDTSQQQATPKKHAPSALYLSRSSSLPRGLSRSRPLSLSRSLSLPRSLSRSLSRSRSLLRSALGFSAPPPPRRSASRRLKVSFSSLYFSCVRHHALRQHHRRLACLPRPAHFRRCRRCTEAA